MAFDWTDYLRLAEALNSGSLNSTEAQMRSSVSRAYYSVFNLCRIKSGCGDKTPDIHRKVGIIDICGDRML